MPPMKPQSEAGEHSQPGVSDQPLLSAGPTPPPRPMPTAVGGTSRSVIGIRAEVVEPRPGLLYILVGQPSRRVNRDQQVLPQA